MVGSRYRVRGDCAIAVGHSEVELPDGTTLELANVDQHWDHTHRMILSKELALESAEIWPARRDSNPRPTDPKSVALIH